MYKGELGREIEFNKEGRQRREECLVFGKGCKRDGRKGRHGFDIKESVGRGGVDLDYRGTEREII